MSTAHTSTLASLRGRIERLEAHPAGAADRLVDRTRRLQHQRQHLQRAGQLRGIGECFRAQAFAQQARFDTLDPQPALQMTRH